MRLVSFRYLDRFPRAGMLLGDLVIDLSAAAPLVFEELGEVRWQLIDLLNGVPDGMGLDGVAEIAAAVLDQLGVISSEELTDPHYQQMLQQMRGALAIGGVEMLIPSSEIKLFAPLPRPTSLRLFEAFPGHQRSLRQLFGLNQLGWTELLEYQYGNHTTIIGPDQVVPFPNTQQFDYECELGIVIGKAGYNLNDQEALEYIAGLTIINDWRMRDLEQLERSYGWASARSGEVATSIGPAIVTLDELEPFARFDGQYDLTMIARVNDQEYSRSSARTLGVTIGQLVAAASQHVTLQPGDILSTGACDSGSLLSCTAASGPWLEPDDLVELEVEGLGILRNRVGL